MQWMSFPIVGLHERVFVQAAAQKQELVGGL